MPRGDKSSYSSRQKRKAADIEKRYERKGVSKKTAAKRAWATVNKQEGGAAKQRTTRKTATKKTSTGISGAGRKSTARKTTGRKTARKTATKRATKRTRR